MRTLVSVVLGILVLVGSWFIYQNISEKKNAPKGKAFQKTSIAYFTEVNNGAIPVEIKTNGTLKAQERLELYAEVQGVFKATAKAFKPGQRFNKGELLLAIDEQEFVSSIIAQRSQLYDNIVGMLPDLKFDQPKSFNHWNAYLNEFDINQKLKPLPEPVNEREKFFISGKQIVSTYYSIKNLEERLSKYRLYAPFAGVLTEALVEKGTLIRTGQKLGTFINNGVFELEAQVNASYLPYIQVGKPVMAHDLNGSNTYRGFITRINGIIDPQTQTVPVFIQISGTGLTEGMFLEAEIQAKSEMNVSKLPRTLLINNEKVYVLESDSLLKLQTIIPVHFTDKEVLVKGLENGAKVLIRSLPGAYEGMVVKAQVQ